MPVPLYDDFDDPVGAFPNYDTYDAAQVAALAAQKHVDIRSFEQLRVTAPYTMFDLDVLTIATLDTLTMGGLESGNVIEPGEAWSAGTVGPQPDRHYFHGISLACTTGANSTASVMLDNGGVVHVDISAFAGTDHISLALPAFPLATLDLTQSFLDLTSEPSGNFATGPTASLAFSAATGPAAGDCEARWPLSALSAINLAKLTGVRLRLQATGACTFRCLAIRCLAASWEFAPIDLNTLYKRVGACVPPTGTATPVYTFPVAAAPVSPADWPVLLRSDGALGPTLTDIEVGAIIHTGSNAALNTFTLYLRELPMRPNTMRTLDGLTMTAVQALPLDYTPAALDDFTHTRFLTVAAQWGTAGSLHIKDETGAGYDFTGITLTADSNYYLLVSLTGNSLRARLYPTTFNGSVDWSTVVADTTAVIDSSLIARRAGRLGWYAQLGDGDSYVRALRPRDVTFREYRSAPFYSATPVEGARLYVDSSPAQQLLGGAVPRPGTTLNVDVAKSGSGHSLRVDCDGNLPLQGLVTSPMRIENLAHTVLKFSVLAPFPTRLVALLRDAQSRQRLLYLPPFAANRWTPMSVPLAQIAARNLPGSFSLYIVQSQTGANTWYIDNLTVQSQTVTWSGRGLAADAWQLNDPEWIEFGEQLNGPIDGALLGRGNTLQLRARALSADASLGALKILPQYSTLGNFVWPEQAPSYPSPLVASFTFTTAGLSASFDGSASTAAAGIAAYWWRFGDATYAYGETVTHAYPTADTYTACLTVIDRLGQEATVCQQVPVALAPPPPPPPPAGAGILFSHNTTRFGGDQPAFLVQADGTGLTQITFPPAGDQTTDNVAWSPDMTKIAISRVGNTEAAVLVCNADGSAPVTLLTGANPVWPDGQPCWTPDGLKIVVGYESTGPASGTTSVGVAFINADGSGRTLVPITVPGGMLLAQFNFTRICISPDGSKLAFTVYLSATGGNYPAVCNIDGSGLTVLSGAVTAPFTEGLAYDWIDNTHVLCDRDDGSNGGQLVSVDIATAAATLIYDGTSTFLAQLTGAAISPDRTQIAFRNNGFGVSVIPIGGGTPVQVYDGNAATPLHAFLPDW